MCKISRICTLLLTLCMFVAVQPAIVTAASTTKASQETRISSKININSADLDSLSQLPGIGKKTAQAIINYRKTNGKFKTPADLLNVKGIGQKKFDKLKSLLSV